MKTFSINSFPYLTQSLAGVGGVIKLYPEDFVVEELPLYEASGQGTHVYFTIEKLGTTTLGAIQSIAKALGRNARDIGYAGLKDAKALTRQQLSLEHVDPQRLADLSLPKIKIDKITRHTNKIKLGHLRCNRFVIKIRQVGSNRLTQARSILDDLGRRGVPNYFGEQRFGSTGDNALTGRAVLMHDYEQAIRLMIGQPGPKDRDDIRRARELFEAGQFKQSAKCWPMIFQDQIRICRTLDQTKGNMKKAWYAINHTLRKLMVSALQSHLFNQVVAARLASLNRLMVGDLAYKHINGACFRVEDALVEQPRCDAFEISPTGPIFGSRMTPTGGLPGEIEARVLLEAELNVEQFRDGGGLKFKGERRPLRVPLNQAAVQEGRDDRDYFLQLSFELPPGSYATSVTREVCKGERDGSSR